MSVTAVPLQPIQKGSLTKLWVGIALVLLLAVLLTWLSLGGVRDDFRSNENYLEEVGAIDGMQVTDSGLRYRFIREGQGKTAGPDDVVLANYEGRLRDGTVFDSNQQTPFVIGQTIPGFDEALQLAPVGSRIELWIPPELGYGSADIPNPETGEPLIPGDSVLNFEVEVLDIKSREEFEAMLAEQRKQLEAMQAEGSAPAR